MGNEYHNWYQRERKRGNLTCQRIDCTEAREHLLWLQSQGAGLTAVARASGLARNTILRVRMGYYERIHKTTAAKILSVGLHNVEIQYNPTHAQQRSIAYWAEHPRLELE